MIRTPLVLLMTALLAGPALAAPCPAVSAQADMARRMQALQGCLQAAPPPAPPAPADPLAGPRTATVAGCQSTATADPAACVAQARTAPAKTAARRGAKRPARRT